MSDPAAENTATDTEQGDEQKETEEYLLYARVPRKDGDSLTAISAFLEHLADLLSHDDIYVESYEKAEAKLKKLAKEKGEGVGAAGADSTTEKPAGGHKSALYPMYFCHNKF